MSAARDYRVRIIIESVDKATKALKEVEGSINKTTTAAQKAVSSLKALGSGVQIVSSDMLNAVKNIKTFAGEIQAPFTVSEGLLRKMRNEVNKLAVQIPETDEKFRLFGVTLRTLSAGIQSVIYGLLGFNILREIGNWIRDSIRKFAEFEAASVRLAAMSAEAWENIGLVAAYYRAEAAAAARELGVSANEAIAAMEALIKAGLSGTDAASALASAIRLAKLEGIDFATAGNNLVQVMAQFGLAGSEASRVVDVLINASRLGIGTANDFAQGLANCGATARNLGLSLEDTTTWLVILERRFGSAQEAGTHLNRFFLDLYEIAEKLGVPIRDVNGNLRNTNDIILDVIEAARALGGDFQILQERLEGVDMRAIKTLSTFMQMTEDIRFLREEIAKMNVAMKVYEEYMQTMSGQMAKMRSEVEAMSLSAGKFFGNLWLSIQQIGLPVLEAFAVAWSGIAARITGQAIPALESWLKAEMIMGRISKDEAASILASWARAGEVILSTGERIKLTTRDIAEIAGTLGVMNDELRAALIDQEKALSEFFDHLKEAGQLTRDVFEGTIAAALMAGRITAEQATNLAEKYGFLDDKMRKVIETFSQLNKETREHENIARFTAETIEKMARKFGLEEERIVELINKTLGLNIVYDEHERKIEAMMEDYGLTREEAERLLPVLEEEARRHKEAANSVREHATSLEELRSKMLEAAGALINYGAISGP